MKNIVCTDECKRFGKNTEGKRCYHNWQKCVGNFVCHLEFQFCRIQYRVVMFDFKLPFVGKHISVELPFGISVFVKQEIMAHTPLSGSVWYLPFLKLRFVEVKYHYSTPGTDKLVSFSAGPKDYGNKVAPADLDNRIIEFKTAFTNNQKLLGYSGEIYPEQDKDFLLLKELHTPEEKKT